MKRDLLDILCCPVCRGELSLSVRKEDRFEIIEGSLRCLACGLDFPIEEGIPDMLPPGER